MSLYERMNARREGQNNSGNLYQKMLDRKNGIDTKGEVEASPSLSTKTVVEAPSTKYDAVINNSDYDTYSSQKLYASAIDALKTGSKANVVKRETGDSFTDKMIQGIDKTLKWISPNNANDARYQYLTDDELKTYTYLNNSPNYGIEAANEYLDALAPTLNKRMTTTYTDKATDFAENNGWQGGIASTLASTGMNVVGGYTSLEGNIQQAVSSALDSLVYGKKLDLVDAYNGGNLIANTSNALTEGVTNSIDSNVGKFLYGTAKSMLDSGAQMGAMRGLSTLSMALNATASRQKELQDMGANDAQIAIGSALSGAIEYATEKWSVENLLKEKHFDTIGGFLKEIGKQMLGEASEEATSEILNAVVDRTMDAIGGVSDYDVWKQNYLAEGGNPDTLEANYLWQKIKDTGLSALGGAISGGVMGAGGNAIQYHAQVKSGKAIQNYGNVNSLKDQAQSMGRDDLANRLGNNKAGTIGLVQTELTEDAVNKVNDNKASNEERFNALSNLQKLQDNYMPKSGVTDSKGNELKIVGVDYEAETLKTESGDVKFDDARMTEDFQVMLKLASDLDENQQKAFIQNYEGDINTYYNRFNMLYEYGKLSDSKAMEAYIDSTDMNKRSALNIYEAGVRDRFSKMTEANAQNEKIQSIYQKYGKVNSFKKLDDSVISYNGAVEGKIDYKSLDSNQKNNIYVGQALSNALNTNVKLFNSKTDGDKYNGYYDTKTNTIYLDVYATNTGTYGMSESVKTENAILTTMSHELSHWGKAMSPNTFMELRDAILPTLAEEYSKQIGSQISVGQYVKYKHDTQYMALTEEEVEEELVARACENMLLNSDYAKKVLNQMSERESKTFVGKVKEILQKVIKAFKDILGKMSSKSEEYALLSKNIEALEKARSIYDRMLLEASEVTAAVDRAISEGVLVQGEKGEMLASIRDYKDKGREILHMWLDHEFIDNALYGLKETDPDYAKIKANAIKEAEEMKKELDVVYEAVKQYSDSGESEAFSKWATAEFKREENGQFSVIVNNGDYKLNIDYATVCKKREALNAVLNSLVKQNKLNLYTLTGEDIDSINKVIKNNGFEIACALCFVDSKRYRVGDWANTFVSEHKNSSKVLVPGWNDIVDMVAKENGKNVSEWNFTGREGFKTEKNNLISDMKNAKVESLQHIIDTFADGTEQKRTARLLMDHPEYRHHLSASEIIASEGLDSIKKNAPLLYNIVNAHWGSAKPKLAHSKIIYQNDVIRNENFNPKEAFAVGGVRIQSFSDFVPILVFDYVQMITELQAKKLPAHAYTKELSFAKIFGLTGIKINLSAIPRGRHVDEKWVTKKGNTKSRFIPDVEKLKKTSGIKVDEDGYPIDKDGNVITRDIFKKTFTKEELERMVYDTDDESIDLEEAIKLQNEVGYRNNVGVIFVGASDMQIWKMLDDDDIPMIIPYHKSSLNPIVARLRDIYTYNDYTDAQNTRDENGNKIDRKELSDEDKAIYDSLDWYKLLNENGGDPRKAANAYKDICEKRGWLPKFDKFAGHDNYYKLLEDFRMYYKEDGAEVLCPQEAVKMKLPSDYIETIKEATKQYEKDYQRLYNQGGLKDIEDALEPIFNKGASEKGRKNSAKDTEYLELAKNPDRNLFELDSIVKEEAKRNGYKFTMFHETDAKDIHIFDVNIGKNGGTDSETPYGIFTKSSNRNIGLGSRQMALYVKSDKRLTVRNREDVKNKIPALIPYYDKIAGIDKKYSALNEKLEWDELNAFDEWSDEHPDADMDKIYPTSYIIEGKPADIDSEKYLKAFEAHKNMMAEWTEKYNEVAIQCKNVITNYLRDNGYDSMYFIVDGGSRGRETDSLIVLDSNQVKSADPITYDDNGNIIPLSERFKADNQDIRYSVKDSEGNALTKNQTEYFKDSKVRDKNGNLKVMYHGTKDVFSVFDGSKSDDGRSFFFTDSNYVAGTYSGEMFSSSQLEKFLKGRNPEDVVTFDNIETAKQLSDFLELDENSILDIREENGNIVIYDKELDYERFSGSMSDAKYYVKHEMEYPEGNTFEYYLNVTNPLVVDAKGNRYNQLEVDGIEPDKYNEYVNTRKVAEYAKEHGYDGVIFNNIVDIGEFAVASSGEKATVVVAFDSNQIKSTGNKNPTSDSDVRYSTKDSVGNDLSDEQIEYFKRSKVRDEDGNLKLMYHGTPDVFTVFNVSKSDDRSSFFFTDRLLVAQTYSRTVGKKEPAIPIERWVEESKTVKPSPFPGRDYSKGNNVPVYLNVSNPLVIDAGGKEWNEIEFNFKTTQTEKRFADWIDDLVMYTSSFGEEDDIDELIAYADTQGTEEFVNEVIDRGWVETRSDARHMISVAKKIDAFIAKLNLNEEEDNFLEVKNIYSRGKGKASTRYISEYAKESGHDGVIINNVVDTADGDFVSNVVIVYDSNQIKSVANKKPTSHPDIRYSVKEVSFTDERIDSIIAEYGYKRDERTKAYFARIAPDGYLKLTLDDSDLWDWEENPETNGVRPLDAEELKNNPLTPRLIIQNGKVVGHEGRHRMLALRNAGYEFVPIILIDYDTTNIKSPMNEMKLKSQAHDFSEGDVNNGAVDLAFDLIPANNVYRDRIIREYGQSYADLRYSYKDNGRINSGTYFSGGGTVDYALRKILDHQFAVEFKENISMVYRDNLGDHIFNGDVRDFASEKHRGNIEYFHASPVCKDYSKAKNNGEELPLDLETARATAKAIRELHPQVVTVENVAGYKKSKALDIIREALHDMGYKWDEEVYNSADYGAYTSRDRLIIRAVADGELPPLPEKTPQKAGWYEAVADLIPTLEETNIPDWMLERLQKLGINYKNPKEPLFVFGNSPGEGRLRYAYGSQLMPTITANTHSNVIFMPDGRVLKDSPRLLARITGLDDDYKLPTQSTLARTIIGNGIPVKLTQAVVGPLLKSQFPDLELKFSYKDEEGYIHLEAGEELSLDQISRYLSNSAFKKAVREKYKAIYADKLWEEKYKNKERLYEQRAKYKEQLEEAYKDYIEDQRARFEKLKEDYAERIVRNNLKDRIISKSEKFMEKLDKNDKQNHVPDVLKEPLVSLLNSLKLQDLGNENIARKFSTLADKMKEVSGTSKSSLEDLSMYFDTDSFFIDSVREIVAELDAKIEEVSQKTASEKSLKLIDLSTDSLKAINDLLSAINQASYNYDRALSGDTKIRISQRAESSRNYLKSLGKKTKESNWFEKFLAWDNVTQIYAFDRFGEGGKTTFKGFMDGQDKLAKNTSEIIKFCEATFNGEEADAWAKEIQSVKVGDEEYQMTTAQIMELYCLNKRKASHQHMFDTVTSKGEPIKGRGIVIKSIKTNALNKTRTEQIQVTRDDVKRITSKLTARQKEVADSLQKFMSHECADWGNYITMRRFGILQFGDENYYPMSVDREGSASEPSETPQGAAIFRILNMSFTHAVDEKANGALFIGNIFDTFLKHANEMAVYNAMGLPILDAFKWMSYSEENYGTKESMKTWIREAYGSEAVSWLLNYLTDLNGKTNNRINLEEGIDKLITNYKTAAVSANLRVALMQPTAYLKALALMDSKYLKRAFSLNPSEVKKAVSDMKKSPLGMWKTELGMFDLNVGRSTASKALQTEDVKGASGWKSKAMDKSMILAEKGDEVTWGMLYKACQLEVSDTTHFTGEAFENAVNERFREICYRTQVFDSINARSQAMRSKNTLMKIMTSFGSEPTLSYSMLSNELFMYAHEKKINKGVAWQKHGKNIMRTYLAWGLCELAVSMVAGIPDMIRDDDDEESFADGVLKYFKKVFENFSSDVVMLPLLRDAFSVIVEGFDPSRPDEEILVSARKVIRDIQKIFDGNASPYKTVYDFAKLISHASGIPFGNVVRGFKSVWNKLLGDVIGKIE